MSTSLSSRTAEFMALFRALETLRSPDKRLFADPMAAGFLPPSLKLALHLASLPAVGKSIPGFIDYYWPGARSSGVARTSLIDDLTIEALEGGLTQVVILGAGFDARPYRLPHAAATRFFEVDQPATSQAKRRIIKERLGVLPSDVAFVETDFNRQKLGPALDHAGFRAQQPAFFLWEGVTNYLTERAVDVTLRWIGSCAASSRLVFTYMDKKVIAAPASFPGGRRLLKMLARVGERWTFGLDPAELREYLADRGFELIADFGATDYRTRYLGGPGEGYEFYHVAVARVVGSREANGTTI